MERKELVNVAGLLGIKKNLSSEEMLKQIEAKLAVINENLNPTPKVPSAPLAEGRKVEDGRRGFHPITGELV